MIIFLQELVLQLFIWTLRLIDGIMEIFSSLTGISTVTFNGEQANIIELTLSNSTIEYVFWCVFVLAIGLSCLFTIISLFKNMVSNNREVKSIIGKFFLSILGTMVMIVTVVLMILISNEVLKIIANIFNLGSETKLSQAVFNACVGEYLNGYSMLEIDVSSLTVRDIFGDYKTAALGIWPTSWKGNGMVNPDSFLYLSSILASIGLSLAMMVASINLAKRIFEMVYMFIVMPISMATLSIDDGARFKVWREGFLSRILIGYGTVFSMNIFIILTPLLSSVHLDNVSSFGNSIFLMIVMISGAMLIPAGQEMFIHLFGSGEEIRANGSGFVRGFVHGSRSASLFSLGLVTKTIRGGTKLVEHEVTKHKDKKFKEEELKNNNIIDNTTSNSGISQGEDIGNKVTSEEVDKGENNTKEDQS